MSSDATSSLDSSCVIISSRTSSESDLSFSILDKTWMRPSAPQSTSPHKVSEWVASCHSAVVDESTDGSRDRLLSMYSNSSHIVEPMKHEAEEWLSQTVPLSRKSVAGSVCSQSEPWLRPSDSIIQPTNGGRDWLKGADTECSWLNSVNTENAWLSSAPSNVESEKENWIEEKSGDVPLKINTDDAWLAKTPEKSNQVPVEFQKQTLGWLVDRDSNTKSTFLATDDWLAGEEKIDEPERISTMISKTDDSWLLIKDELTRIGKSKQSEWIIGNGKITGSVLSGADNRLFVSDS